MTRPEFLYKYREDTPRSVEALLACQAMFSGRNGFNDPLDARLKLLEVSIDELERLDFANRISLRPDVRNTRRYVERRALTSDGRNLVQQLYQRTEELIDSYRFYCLGANSTSNLMWAHYASSHTGYCIEFKSEFVGGDQVIYDDKRPEIRIGDYLLDPSNQQIGTDIWLGLRTKRKYWAYEEEYRIQPSNEMKAHLVRVNADTDSAEYQPEWVESIIFGYRMPVDRRRYIVQNYKHPVKFKQVVSDGEGFAITDFC